MKRVKILHPDGLDVPSGNEFIRIGTGSEATVSDSLAAKWSKLGFVQILGDPDVEMAMVEDGGSETAEAKTPRGRAKARG